jgi:cytochrome P450
MRSSPPGPAGPLLATVRALRDPYAALAGYARRYGDPFTLPLLMPGPVVVTGDPSAIRAAFAMDPDSLGSSQARTMGPILGASSLVALEGAAHRRARKLLNPPFHGDRMRAYGDVMRDAARSAMADLEPGARFAVQELAGTIALDVIVRVAFGARRADQAARLDRAIRDLMGALGPFVAFECLRRRFGGVGPWAKFLRLRASLAALVDEAIAARRAEGAPGEDILGMLLAARYEDGAPMTNEDIFAQLLTLVAAGHETTVIALTWVLYWLHRCPEELERLRAEIERLGPDPASDALARLPILGWAVDEALRVNPVVPLVTRRLLRNLAIPGYVLPEGTVLGLATSLVHARAELYPDPAQFRPMRFAQRSFGPSEYFPFGGGARRCLGAAFALYEAKIVLGTILRSLRLGLADARPLRAAMGAAGMGPARLLEMVVIERSARPVWVSFKP